MKREATFTTKLRRWLMKTDYIKKSAGIEVKVTNGKSIRFDAVKSHQTIALYMAKDDKLAYKAPDDSAGHKPFDLFYLRKADAYVCLAFLVPRSKRQQFWMIDVKTFTIISNTIKKKSVTHEDLLLLREKKMKGLRLFSLGTNQ